jgi:hypothetical protein
LGARVLITYQAVGLLEPHAVDDDCRGGNEEDLHEGVVHRNEVPEYVHVPQQEHQQVDFLGLARKTYSPKKLLVTHSDNLSKNFAESPKYNDWMCWDLTCFCCVHLHQF